jgi:hypothetical protein
MKEEKFGLLGKSYPETDIADLVYEVPDMRKVTEININVVNTLNAPVKVWIYITSEDTYSTIDAYESGVSLSPSAVLVRNEKCSAGEKIIFISSPKGAVMRVSGIEGNIGG